MRLSIIALVAGLATTNAFGRFANAAPRPQRGETSISLPTVERFVLANGLEVAVIASATAPVVSVQVWYRVGSKEERRDRRGSAHMFEHMMFKGSRRVRPEQHAQMINGVGGTTNAATEQDSTRYFNSVPAQHLDFAISLEAERMRGLLFRPAMVEKEKEVVLEELRQEENSPFIRGLRSMLSAAFEKHPYAWTARGNAKDIEAISLEDLRSFYDTYYQPNNALLVVVGNTTAAAVRESAERHFGVIPRGKQPPPRPANDATEPAQTAARRVTGPTAGVGVVLIGYKVPAANHADTYALQVAQIVLGGGESSRLKRRIQTVDAKTKAPIGIDAAAQALTLEHPGLMILIGAHLDEGGAARVEAALADEAKKLGDKGPAAEELQKAKNSIRAYVVGTLEDTSSLANHVGRSWVLTGDVSTWTRDIGAIEKVTAADVARVAKTYLRPELATTVVIPRK